MKTQLIAVSKLVLNPKNPRTITDASFQRLVKSIRDFPDMMQLRPVVVTPDMVVIAGNMRLRACIEDGWEKVPTIIADKLTPEQVQEFIIKDNLPFGEWDFDMLANEWDADDLTAWGLSIPDYALAAEDEETEDDSKYTDKIKPLAYEAQGYDVTLDMMHDTSRRDALVALIRKNEKKLPTEVVPFLLEAANRFVVYNYKHIAEYYSQSDNEAMRTMFQELAVVVLDLNAAIDAGLVVMQAALADIVAKAKAESGDDDA